MKIEYRKGCLIVAAKNGEIQALGHGCNCFNTMKSGIAPQIARAYPMAHGIDQCTERGDKEKLGTISFVTQEEEPYLIFNLYTQYDFGYSKNCYLDYEAVESAMYVLNQQILLFNNKDHARHVTYVGFPKLGAGLAGGNWEKISSIIEKTITAATPVVYERD